MALVAFLSGCGADDTKCKTLGLKWKPPRGAKKLSDKDGQCAWEPGISLGTVQPALPPIDDEHLQELSVRAAPEYVKRISSRTGSIPLGPVARFVLETPENQRILVYYVKAKEPLELRMGAPKAQFSDAENQFDLALGTLKME